MPWSTEKIRAVYLGAIGPNVENFTGVKKKVDFVTYDLLSENHLSPEDQADLHSQGEVVEEGIHEITFN